MSSWYAGRMIARDEIKKSHTILEIGAGDFSTPIILAKRFTDKKFFALDLDFCASSIPNLKELPSNLAIIKADATDLDFFESNYFDFVYSIAVGEHIHNFARHLEEVFRIIKAGGIYYFTAAPLWSSAMGHHYKHWIKPEKIPHYAHLYMTPEGLLANSNLGESDDPEDVIDSIYKRDGLSRLNYLNYKNIIEKCQFDIVNYEIVPETLYEDNYWQKINANNIYGVSEEELKIRGIRVDLIKNSQ